MKKLPIAILLAATVVGSISLVAMAQPDGPKGPGGGMMLEKIDLNGDGNITKDEISASKADRFASADTNGDGAVTAQEFEAAHEAHRAERQARRADRMFARLDADGDGVITAEEHAAHTDERMERRFAKVDTDGDGVITAAEREAAKTERHPRRGHGKRGDQN